MAQLRCLKEKVLSGERHQAIFHLFFISFFIIEMIV